MKSSYLKRILTNMAIAGAVMQVVPSLGQVDPAQRAVFDQCAACHSTDGTNGTGPTLKGVFGRSSGTVAGFRYSRAMRGAGITWDERTLDQYLSDPQAFIAGNVMPFSGVPDPGERASIIAYLRSLK
jgi:cytochrome c